MNIFEKTRMHQLLLGYVLIEFRLNLLIIIQSNNLLAQNTIFLYLSIEIFIEKCSFIEMNARSGFLFIHLLE